MNLTIFVLLGNLGFFLICLYKSYCEEISISNKQETCGLYNCNWMDQYSPNVAYMEPRYRQYVAQIQPVWDPDVAHIEPRYSLYLAQVQPIFNPYGTQIPPIWDPCGSRLQNQCGSHMGSPYGSQMGTHMGPIWDPYTFACWDSTYTITEVPPSLWRLHVTVDWAIGSGRHSGPLIIRLTTSVCVVWKRL